MYRILIIFCSAILLSGCSEEPTAFDHAPVDDVYKQFAIAYRKADISMVREIYADTAIYLNPGDAIDQGTGAFLDNFSTMFSQARSDTAQLSIEFKIINRTPTEDKVVDIGYYHFIREKAGDEKSEAVGKFITMLQRQADGSYKFIADIFNYAPLDAWDQ